MTRHVYDENKNGKRRELESVTCRLRYAGVVTIKDGGTTYDGGELVPQRSVAILGEDVSDARQRAESAFGMAL